MKKIIALNWKHTQTHESAPSLFQIAINLEQIYPDFTWILFPGDELLPSFRPSLELVEWREPACPVGRVESKISLGNQHFSAESSLPYCLVWHMSARLQWLWNEEIRTQLNHIQSTAITPILCIWPLVTTDTIEQILSEQLIVLDNWPTEKPIIVAYEPSFSIGNGKTISLEDIEIVYDILSKSLERFTHKHILYGGSVDDTNISNILEITDGVIVGTASQNASSLLALSIALWQSENL